MQDQEPEEIALKTAKHREETMGCGITRLGNSRGASCHAGGLASSSLVGPAREIRESGILPDSLFLFFVCSVTPTLSLNT